MFHRLRNTAQLPMRTLATCNSNRQQKTVFSIPVHVTDWHTSATCSGYRQQEAEYHTVSRVGAWVTWAGPTGSTRWLCTLRVGRAFPAASQQASQPAGGKACKTGPYARNAQTICRHPAQHLRILFTVHKKNYVARMYRCICAPA